MTRIRRMTACAPAGFGDAAPHTSFAMSRSLNFCTLLLQFREHHVARAFVAGEIFPRKAMRSSLLALSPG